MIKPLRRIPCVLLLAASPLAFAHASLVASTPTKGATLDRPPTELRLTFNERVEAAYTSVRLVDARGKEAASAKAVADPADARSVKFAVPSLASGTYVARWTAVGDDGHRTHGEFSFSVR